MKLKPSLNAVAACLLLAATQAGAVTIDFEGLAEGAILSNQYAGLGVTFSPNAFSGTNSNSTTQGWATNTGMTVTATDIGAVGTPALASGKLLHSFGDWLSENGDPSILATFSTPITSFSAVFAGIFTAGDTTLTAYNGNTIVGVIYASACTVTCQQVLSVGSGNITKVAMTPGSYGDWVGIDNIIFTPVPEAGTWAMMGLGMGLLALRRRRSA